MTAVHHKSKAKSLKPAGRTYPRFLLPLAWLLLLSGGGLILLTGIFDRNIEKRTAEDQPVNHKAGLPNFYVVHPYLFRGGAPTLEGLRKLKEMGVKTVIDLRVKPEWVLRERLSAANLGLTYINLPTGDFGPKPEQERIFLTTLQQAESNPQLAPVFLHCAHGSDRTGWYVGIWRMKHDGWSFPQAFAEMLNHGFVIHRLFRPFQSQPRSDAHDGNRASSN